MFKPLCFIALFTLTGISQASAQTTIHVDIGPCLTFAAEVERDACYVARAEEARLALRAIESMAAPAVDPAQSLQPISEAGEPPAASLPVTAEEFGRNAPAAVMQQISYARVLANEDGEQELVGTIASLDERMPNMWDVTLSNDQVWRQVNSDVYRLQKGMEVRIYPSPFAGSFRLSATGRNGFIQVRRIR